MILSLKWNGTVSLTDYAKIEQKGPKFAWALVRMAK